MAKHRLQFDFNDEALKEIDALREETGLPTRAELIRHALKFFQWTLNEKKNGSSVLLEKNNKTREVIFPFWDAGSSRTSE